MDMTATPDLGIADAVLAPGHGRVLAGRVALDHEARCLRRKRLVTVEGAAFLVDLPRAVSLAPGAALALADGRAVAVVEAPEPVLRIEGDLPTLAWHIGNRHCPCGVAADHLVIRADPVLEAMLVGLGARVTRSFAPFRPLGGAYGHGRTVGHGP